MSIQAEDLEKRIEVSEQSGKKFIYFDMSYLKGNAEFNAFVEAAKARIAEFPPNASLLAITNIEGIVYDTETKEAAAEWLDFNKPYVKASGVVGMDGIKKIMLTSMLKLSSRRNIKIFSSLEETVDWLLLQ